MRYDCYFTSTKGSHHLENEDSVYINDGIIIIADGMGGECCGEIASSIAVKTMSEVLQEKLYGLSSEPMIGKLLLEATAKADEAISQYIGLHRDALGMGTTVLVAILKGCKLYLAWCGDSRCYLYEENEVSLLTKDHSFVQELVDAGELGENEAISHPDSNIITRFVGGGSDMCRPDFKCLEIPDSTLLILCSDGLSGYCRKDEIEHVIQNTDDVENLPVTLRELAIRKGSDDDITIVVLRSETYPPHPPERSFFTRLKRKIKERF